MAKTDQPKSRIFEHEVVMSEMCLRSETTLRLLIVIIQLISLLLILVVTSNIAQYLSNTD